MNDILIGKIASASQLHGIIHDAEHLHGVFGLFTLPTNQYDGSYVFTPSDQEQIIPTYNTTVLGDIIINANPQVEYYSPYILPLDELEWSYVFVDSGCVNVTLNASGNMSQFVKSNGYATTEDVTSAILSASGEVQLPDGNVIEYGSDEGTRPIVGSAQVGYAVLKVDSDRKTRPIVGLAQAGYAKLKV